MFRIRPFRIVGIGSMYVVQKLVRKFPPKWEDVSDPLAELYKAVEKKQELEGKR